MAAVLNCGGDPVKSALATVGMLCLVVGTARADDTVRLNGSQAATVNLKGSATQDAETISVFHGRLFGCCRGCCAPVVCCPPPPTVYYGCTGCAGGYGGYSMGAVAPGYGYAAAPRQQMYAPAYAFDPREAFQFQYPTQQPRAIVALPRLGLQFSLGESPDVLTSRYSNQYRPSPMPRDEQPAQPPFQAQPDQFRYDGGPAAPVPMPGNLRPLPNVAPQTPTLNNRVKANVPQQSWLAYGERQNSASDSQLVRTRAR